MVVLGCFVYEWNLVIGIVFDFEGLFFMLGVLVMMVFGLFCGGLLCCD